MRSSSARRFGLRSHPCGKRVLIAAIATGFTSVAVVSTPCVAAGSALPRGHAATLPALTFLEGDSLSVDSAAILRSLMGSSKVIVDARKGRHTWEGVERIRKRKSLPGAVVVALGTNDDWDAEGIANYRIHVSRIMSLLGPHRCVVWINSFQQRTAKQVRARKPMIFAGLNRVLLDMARRTPNVRLVDWATISSRHPEWYAYDPVHPTDSGYRARARLIVDALSKCRYVPPPAPPVAVASLPFASR